jgi:hypothetical protein
MMSAATLTVRGLVPECFIHLAKTNPIFYHLPLALPNGLLLLYGGFCHKAQVQLTEAVSTLWSTISPFSLFCGSRTSFKIPLSINLLTMRPSAIQQNLSQVNHFWRNIFTVSFIMTGKRMMGNC